MDAPRPLFVGAEGPALRRVGRLPVIGASRIVEEVVPVAARLTLSKLAQLGDELQIVAPFDELHDLLLVPSCRSAQQVDEAVGVARDEVDGPVANALAFHQVLDRLPPATSRPDVADLRATEHADSEVFFLGLDSSERLEEVAPDFHQP